MFKICSLVAIAPVVSCLGLAEKLSKDDVSSAVQVKSFFATMAAIWGIKKHFEKDEKDAKKAWKLVPESYRTKAEGAVSQFVHTLFWNSGKCLSGSEYKQKISHDDCIRSKKEWKTSIAETTYNNIESLTDTMKERFSQTFHQLRLNLQGKSFKLFIKNKNMKVQAFILKKMLTQTVVPEYERYMIQQLLDLVEIQIRDNEKLQKEKTQEAKVKFVKEQNYIPSFLDKINLNEEEQIEFMSNFLELNNTEKNDIPQEFDDLCDKIVTQKLFRQFEKILTEIQHLASNETMTLQQLLKYYITVLSTKKGEEVGYCEYDTKEWKYTKAVCQSLFAQESWIKLSEPKNLSQLNLSKDRKLFSKEFFKLEFVIKSKSNDAQDQQKQITELKEMQTELKELKPRNEAEHELQKNELQTRLKSHIGFLLMTDDGKDIFKGVENILTHASYRNQMLETFIKEHHEDCKKQVATLLLQQKFSDQEGLKLEENFQQQATKMGIPDHMANKVWLESFEHEELQHFVLSDSLFLDLEQRSEQSSESVELVNLGDGESQ
jgi:hypothetical protein